MLHLTRSAHVNAFNISGCETLSLGLMRHVNYVSLEAFGHVLSSQV